MRKSTIPSTSRTPKVTATRATPIIVKNSSTKADKNAICITFKVRTLKASASLSTFNALSSALPQSLSHGRKTIASCRYPLMRFNACHCFSDAYLLKRPIIIIKKIRIGMVIRSRTPLTQSTGNTKAKNRTGISAVFTACGKRRAKNSSSRSTPSVNSIIQLPESVPLPYTPPKRSILSNNSDATASFTENASPSAR